MWDPLADLASHPWVTYHVRRNCFPNRRKSLFAPVFKDGRCVIPDFVFEGCDSIKIKIMREEK